MSTGDLLLEIICSSPHDCQVAEQAGANRIELCAAIELGGLTPSLGILEESLSRTKLPIMAMVRPRTGGFCYTESEFAGMLRDVAAFRRAGARGVVFGILTPACEIDVNRCQAMVEAANGMETVFHRAFDVVADPFAATEKLISLGIKRVLTSGQQEIAVLGAALIRDLIRRYGSRIEILPGGGLRASNLNEFWMTTPVTQVHLSAFAQNLDPSMVGAELGFNGRPTEESIYRTVSGELVEEIRRSLEAGGHDA